MGLPLASGKRDRGELRSQSFGGGRSVVASLGKRPPEDAIDRGDGGRSRERRRLLVKGRVENLDHCRSPEGRPAGEHLEKDGAEGEEIGPGVDFFTPDLLGSHVSRGSHDHSRTGELGGVFSRPGQVFRGPSLACEAEVEELHSVRSQEDVGGLEVAMDQPASVQRGKGGKRREGDGHGLGRGKGAALQTFREGVPLEELHRDVEGPLVLADLVELTNVWMVDGGGGPRLPAEAAHRGLVGELRGDQLDGDAAVELVVSGRVDDPHPSLP